MARYFLPIDNASPERLIRNGKGEVIAGGGIEKGTDPQEPNMLKVPAAFGGGKIPLKKGGIAFGFRDHGFHHLGPGEFVDLPEILTEKQVKLMAPQLLSKREAIEAGIANDDGTMRMPEKAAKQRQ